MSSRLIDRLSKAKLLEPLQNYLALKMLFEMGHAKFCDFSKHAQSGTFCEILVMLDTYRDVSGTQELLLT